MRNLIGTGAQADAIHRRLRTRCLDFEARRGPGGTVCNDDFVDGQTSSHEPFDWNNCDKYPRWCYAHFPVFGKGDNEAENYLNELAAATRDWPEDRLSRIPLPALPATCCPRALADSAATPDAILSSYRPRQAQVPVQTMNETDSYLKWGRFLEHERCFELTAEPPKRWFNVHTSLPGDNEVYTETSNLGDGPITIRDTAGNICQLVPYDAKYLYIRDDDTNVVFNPWGAPCAQPTTQRSCRYYAEKTVITGVLRAVTRKSPDICPRRVCQRRYGRSRWTIYPTGSVTFRSSPTRASRSTVSVQTAAGPEPRTAPKFTRTWVVYSSPTTIEKPPPDRALQGLHPHHWRDVQRQRA